jgi:hypothetical protein
MKTKISFLFLFSLLLVGCDGLSKFTQFEMPFTSTVTIPKSTGLNLPFNIPTPEIETNSATFFSTNNINTDLIEKIELKKMELTVTSPASGNFNFLKSFEIYITAEGLEETKIAWIDDIANNEAMPLKLSIDKIDLKQFIMKDKFGLNVKTTTDELTATDYTIEIKTAFMIDVKVLGL